MSLLDKVKEFAESEEVQKGIQKVKENTEEILSEGHQKELSTYKGVMVSKSHAERDMFKINLLNMLDK